MKGEPNREGVTGETIGLRAVVRRNPNMGTVAGG